jgi:hypothetical protein
VRPGPEQEMSSLTRVFRTLLRNLILEEVRAVVGDPRPAAAGGRGPNFPSFTEVVYKELSKKS